MTEQDQIKLYKDQIERTIDVNRVISVVLRRWYVLIACIVVAVSVAYIQLRYTKPLYTATIQIKVEDDKGNQVGDLFLYGRISGRIENQLKTESKIFKSTTLGLQTLKKLGYDISYFQKGQFVTSELYPFPYFKIIPLYLIFTIIHFCTLQHYFSKIMSNRVFSHAICPNVFRAA